MYVYKCPECQGRGISLVSEAPGPGPRCRNHTPPVLMDLLPDTASALLPLDPQPQGTLEPGSNGDPRYVSMSPRMNAQMVPLKVEHLHYAGILQPATQDALEWLYRHRERNGMSGAFLKVGGRRCIDLVAFAKLMRERRA